MSTVLAYRQEEKNNCFERLDGTLRREALYKDRFIFVKRAWVVIENRTSRYIHDQLHYTVNICFN